MEVVVDAATLLPMLMSKQVDAVLEQSTLIGRFRKVGQQQGMTAMAMRYADCS